MKARKISTTALLVGAGLTLGAGAGVLAGVHGFGSSSPAAAVSTAQSPAASETPALTPLATNAAGQTYGSMLGRELDPPDLVLIVNADGLEGYVPKEYLQVAVAANPEEAAAITRASEAARSAPVVYPMYASDGVTLIGEVEMSAPTVTLDY